MSVPRRRQDAFQPVAPRSPLAPGRTLVALGLLILVGCEAGPSDDGSGAVVEDQGMAEESPAPRQVQRGPRSQPGTEMGIYTPEQHDLYDGRFVLEGGNIYQAGTLSDEAPWDHMDDDASDLRSVEGRAVIDVNEIENTGTFRAELALPEGQYVVELEEWVEFSPCQDGGIAAYLFEHGDSGCGDANWPKSLLYVAGWGRGSATLDGEPLYQDYQIHFMVTQGMRDRETLQVASGDASTPAGSVNPAAMQLDFYIRSPEANEANHPSREVFDHFFAMEVTWR